MPTHALFIDDSGTKEYDDDGRYGSHNSRHFVFGGVLLDATEGAGRLARQVQQLKSSAFGTDAVEVKSNWLRIQEERQARYLEPFAMDDGELDAFVEDLYQLIEDSGDLMLIASVVDKVQMKEDYPDNTWYPPALAYETLLQRVQMEMDNYAGSKVAVTMDDTSGKTPKGNPYKTLLGRHHEQLKKTGSTLQRGFIIPALSGRLRFVNSAHSDLVQVADIVAYNVLRQFRDYAADWEDPSSPLPVYAWLDRLLPSFRLGPNQRFQGYGIAKIPMRRRVRWRL